MIHRIGAAAVDAGSNAMPMIERAGAPSRRGAVASARTVLMIVGVPRVPSALIGNR